MDKRVVGLVGLLLIVVAVLPGAAAAQVPAGGEFRVNTYTTSVQAYPGVAMDPGGNFVVVWSSAGADGSIAGIVGQRFDATGTPAGGEFRVNTYTTGQQALSGVAMDAGGNFVVVWAGNGLQDDVVGIFGQRFDATGTPAGGEFRVNTYTTGVQFFPAVAMDPAGNFVVVWAAYGGDYGIFGQRYDATGAPRGAEFQVNTYTTFVGILPRVATDAGGNFVVVWSSYGPYGIAAVGRRFDAAGIPAGPEFGVSTYTTNPSGLPAVAMDPAGNFVVVWMTQDCCDYGIAGQRYDPTGAPSGSEFRVNTYTTDYQVLPAVAMDAAGNFVVVWSSYGQNGPGYGVIGQRYDAAGAPRGGEFQVNSSTISASYPPQLLLGVAMDPVGNFVVVWASGSDGDSYGVLGQRYGGLLPAALAVDPAGNGVLEPGETVVVAPGWRNVNGGPLTFTGAASQLTGPPGATYTLVDPAASYGTVPNATLGSCGADCFQVSVSRPATRPATHWDLTVRETIGPPALGQTTVWTLHVGESFADVPPAHLFYRFIETLLHHGVTAGCTATTYCPDGVTTREQMAISLLRALEGAGFAPPPCTTAPFPDVPCSSPFAPWIQELVARGITAGCGGGLYCPTAPVTREQMAVFLLRNSLGAGFLPAACTTAPFADVPCSSPFAPWIQELVTRGITAGCGGGLYCPTDPVTRGQMAPFVTKTFGLALYGP
jgi:hypothetical protein